MGTLTKFLPKSVWGQTLLLLLGWNLALRLLGVAGYFLLPERFAPLDFIGRFWQSNFLWWSFANFDGEHYLSIAKFGYQLRSGFPQYAFFPLLPLLIRLATYLVGDYFVAGTLVSQGFLWVGLTYLSKWCRTLKLPDIRLLLLASTGAVFLASIYTEPVFVALAAMTMYFTEKKEWGRAVLATALATATRANGPFLVLFLVIKLLQAKKSWFFAGLSGLAASAGLFGYMLFLYFKTGDALNWFRSHSAWGKTDATSPLVTAVAYFRAVTVTFQPDLIHLVVIFEILVTLIALALFIRLLQLRRLDLAYWVYLGGNLAMPIMTGSLGSMPRFFLLLFPVLTVIPSLSKWGRNLYYILSLPIAGAGVVLFTRGWWYG